MRQMHRNMPLRNCDLCACVCNSLHCSVNSVCVCLCTCVCPYIKCLDIILYSPSNVSFWYQLHISSHKSSSYVIKCFLSLTNTMYFSLSFPIFPPSLVCVCTVLFNVPWQSKCWHQHLFPEGHPNLPEYTHTQLHIHTETHTKPPTLYGRVLVVCIPPIRHSQLLKNAQLFFTLSTYCIMFWIPWLLAVMHYSYMQPRVLINSCPLLWRLFACIINTSLCWERKQQVS